MSFSTTVQRRHVLVYWYHKSPEGLGLSLDANAAAAVSHNEVTGLYTNTCPDMMAALSCTPLACLLLCPALL